MATPDVRTILRLPGFFVKNPSTTSGGMPFGGTALGLAASSELRIVPRSKLVTAEEFGGQVVKQIYCGETVIIATALRDYDAAAIAAVFPTASGSHVDMNVTSGTRAGDDLETFKLMFCPVAYSTHPFIYFPAATGLPDESGKLRMSLASEVNLGVVFRALPDSSGCVYQIGTAGSISF